MKMHRIIAGLPVVAGLALATAAQAQAPQRGGQLDFAISQGEPATFDCHAASSVNVMFRVAPHYSTLLRVDPANYPNVMGDLAQSWTVSPDGALYTFKLAPNAKFHDGSLVTSEDVKVSLERIRNPPPGVVSVRKELLADVADISTPDAATVVVRLARPNAAMPSVFAMPYGCIYSAKMLQGDPDYPAKKVMGSGPFKFVRYTPGAEWIGERNNDFYRQGFPYLDGFRALSLAPAATVNALAAGQVAFDFRGVSKAEADRIVQARGDKVNVFESNPAISLLFYIAFNAEKGPLADPRVRRALALSVDHFNGAKVIERTSPISAVGGLVRPGSQFARPEAELAKLPGFSRDMAAARTEAKKLLAEAGQTDLKLTFLNRRPWPFIGVFLVDQFKQVGVTLTHEQQDDPQFFARRNTGAYDMILDALPDYIDDPTIQWAGFKSFDKNPGNGGRFTDPRVDELLEKQARETDPKARVELVRQLEDHMLTQAYVMPFFWSKRITTVDASVQGYVAAPTNFIGIDLERFWLKK